jgi:hypothetical protein
MQLFEMKISGKNIAWIFSVAVAITVAFNSCTKEDDAPLNPYDEVNYNPDSTALSNPDPNSIVGLHRNIFSPRCANPGCHDGTFEPDYRTVQSTYSTLVYQPVNRNTVDSVHYFTLRVIPFNVSQSLLHERLTTPTSNFMPSNGTGGGRLSAEEIQHIDTWIANGAKDENGNVPVAPNLPPFINGFLAADSVYVRIDTIRVGGISYYPIIVHSNQTVLLVPLISDDSTAVQNLTVNKVKLSLDMDDFSSAVTVNAVATLVAPNTYFWIATFPVPYPPGTTVYFRYYVNDGTHATDTEFPRTDLPIYYKMYASFYIQ